MAGITKTNPTLPNTSRSFNGKTMMGFTIDFAVNATDFSATEMGALGAVQIVLGKVAETATVIGHSALRADGGANAGQLVDVYIEGNFVTDTYDGSNAETFAADLEDRIQALTSVGVGSVNLSSATVTALTGFPLYASP